MNNEFNNVQIFFKSTEIVSDLETPVSTFYKFCKDKKNCFLLESAEGGEKVGRYSVIGFDPLFIFKNDKNKTELTNCVMGEKYFLDDNPYIALKSLLSKISIDENSYTDFIGFIGYFGYDTVRWVEPSTKFSYSKNTPDVILTFPSRLIIFDHLLGKVSLIVISFSEKSLDDALLAFIKMFSMKSDIPQFTLNATKNSFQIESNFSKDEYISVVEECKKHIVAGDIFQIVPSRKIKVQGSYDPLVLYRILRNVNPSPYLFCLEFDDFSLCGSSPEVMAKCVIKGNKKVAYLRPIAGTYPRGKDDAEDKKNIEKLLNDQKERAEHLMLIDLARNDLGRVCESGSVKVSELMVVEKYSHVLHIVSLVEGILKPEMTSVDLLMASFPAGTLSGAPKVKALELINKFENEQRGPYGGALGFFGLNDTSNTCMTIRTFLVFPDRVEIQAGGGVVADSNPESEFEETLRKSGALLKTLENYPFNV